MKKVFIDGNQGTTGLKIYDRLKKRSDIELITIDESLRKDITECKKLINSSDITFLCLPDSAAIEAVALIENENVKIIDTSTAHRTEKSWAYGFAELSPEYRSKIENSSRVSVPGCHASGFVSLVFPLIKCGIIDSDYPVVSHSLTGYSGGGKKMISEYENSERSKEFDSPRQYALTQQHKHLKEMKFICGLEENPVFTPVVADYFSGMLTTVPLFVKMMNKKMTVSDLRDFYSDYYKNQKLIKVLSSDECNEQNGYLASNAMAGYDNMQIIVTGNDDRIMLTSRFDNLGKGASGAAIQCMNIMLGIEETKGLLIK